MASSVGMPEPVEDPGAPHATKRMTPDRSAPEGLVEALAPILFAQEYPATRWDDAHHALQRTYLAMAHEVAEALAPTVAQLIDAAVAQRTAHLVIEAERLREVVGRVETVLRDGPETWEGYNSRDTGWTFLAETVLEFTADLRAALHPSGAAGADLRASQGVPGVSGPTEAPAGAREAGEG